jgi:uncharacterized DUF497 family protein
MIAAAHTAREKRLRASPISRLPFPSGLIIRSASTAKHGALATVLNNYKFVNIINVVEGIRFEWDEAKNLSNQRKHGVSFQKASGVFLDPFYVTVQERIEDGEPRWQTLGVVGDVLLLTVAHTVREKSDDGAEVEIIRIISARRATRKERRRYEDENS